MKTTGLILLVCFFVNNDKFTFYKGDGTKIGDENFTIGQANKLIDPLSRIHVEHFFTESENKDDYTIIGFKLFTKDILWYATARPVRVQDALDNYLLSDYFKSQDFKSDMEKFINNRSLTDLFILSSLGKPDKKIQSFQNGIGIEIWYYDFRDLQLTFSKGKVISYVHSEE